MTISIVSTIDARKRASICEPPARYITPSYKQQQICDWSDDKMRFSIIPFGTNFELAAALTQKLHAIFLDKTY